MNTILALSCGENALNPKSETLRTPKESRSKFSGCKKAKLQKMNRLLAT